VGVLRPASAWTEVAGEGIVDGATILLKGLLVFVKNRRQAEIHTARDPFPTEAGLVPLPEKSYHFKSQDLTLY
jgi:hypothetical protein